MNDCPSHAHLLALLSDQPEAAAVALETHVESCDACQEALLRLAGDAGFGRWLQAHTRRRPAAADEAPEDFLQRLKRAFRPPGAAPVSADRGDWPSIPRYEILEQVGRGGFGVVYKARQKSLNRLVAVKVFRDDLSPENWERALRVRDLIAELHHPHIVRFHDGLQFDGRYAVVLEYVEGGSLDRALAGKPWPARRAAELVATLAQTVQAVHARGIVHRDLKPSNVLLTADGTPKLADFSLARPLQGGTAITRKGDIVGSPRYMAAEQAAGRDDLGPGVDVYALGAILYELLTGRPPFHGKSALDTLEQVVYEEPAPPSQLRPDTPRDLEAVCLRCLQKDPARRYPSAQELADDLERFLRGVTVQARPVAWWGRAGEWMRRRWVKGALLAALVGVVFVGAFALGEAAQLRRHQRKIEAALDAAEADLYRSRLEAARQALAARNRAQAQAYLDQCAPAAGRPDRREAEWQELWRRCREFADW